jgi:Zn-dependent protease with chaperone function
MNDDYTKMKRDLEDIYATKARMESDIRNLIEQVEKSDHPLRNERLARLRQLLQKLA